MNKQSKSINDKTTEKTGEQSLDDTPPPPPPPPMAQNEPLSGSEEAPPPPPCDSLTQETQIEILSAFLGQIMTPESEFNLHLPTNIFDESPALARMVREIKNTEKVPFEMAASCCLSAISVSVGRGLVLNGTGNYQSNGNLYFIVAAPSGAGKSQVAKLAFTPLWKLDKELDDNWRRETYPKLRAKENVCIQRLKQLNRKGSCSGHDLKQQTELQVEKQRLEDQLGKKPQVLIEDITREALANCMKSSDEVLGLVSADARSMVDNLLGRYARGGNRDDSIYIKCWSGDPHREDRIGRPPVVLGGPCLSMLLLIQHDKLEQLCSESSFVEGGLLPRIMFVKLTSSPMPVSASDRKIDCSTVDEYGALIRGLAKQYRVREKPIEVTLSSEAKQFWILFHQCCAELQKEELHDFQGFVARWAEHATRVALCLHASANPDNPQDVELAEKTMCDAIRIVTWIANHQLHIFGPIRHKNKEERIARLVNILKSKESWTETERNLKNSHGYTKEELGELIERYPDRITREEKATGGRPSKVIKLRCDNPANLGG